MSDNLYQPPNSENPGTPPPPPSNSEFRRVQAANGVSWLTNALTLFKNNPGAWISCMLVMIVILFIMLLIPIVQLLGGIAVSIFTGGIMFGCQQVKYGKDFSMNHLFAGFEKNMNGLIIVGAIYLGGTFVCSAVAFGIASLLGFQPMEIDPNSITAGKFDAEAYLSSLLLPLLIMLGLMVPVIMAYWFAPALVMLRGVPPVDAMKKSFKACSANMIPFLIYGLVAFIALIIVSILTGLVSLIIPVGALSVLISIVTNLIIFSILMASIFTSFEDIFPDETPSFPHESDDDSSSLVA
ncbi:BPSS1780 family membrane protein [Aliikangiella coralliicola]|uniref:DUF975 family protein n=1 Tax=Aliikangiella coralliicola TaxID=2592383 RepID=A0A545UBP4_9GAMM|nr:BPSS1780 family membrane protein [Aliikangiella coralliicola]TQV86886.1 hypothetical protein FLL46_13800 [Aliikangiella coralliicola]